jgi:hypothetical protein
MNLVIYPILNECRSLRSLLQASSSRHEYEQ